MNEGIFILYPDQNTIFIGFVPTENEREKLRCLLNDTIYAWLVEKNIPIKKNICNMFFMEIWKNIFDHAGNRGYVILSWKDSKFSFKALDYGTRPISMKFATRIGASSKHDNDINAGIGVPSIIEFSERLFDSFEIRPWFGMKYSGSKTFKLPE